MAENIVTLANIIIQVPIALAYQARLPRGAHPSPLGLEDQRASLIPVDPPPREPTRQRRA